jgi:PKD repeat protein
MKKILWLIILIPFLAISQTNIYFDPTADDIEEDGTIEHPFNDVRDFCEWSSYGYLIPGSTNLYMKAGTCYVVPNYNGYGFNFSNDSITFTSYGEGNKPILIESQNGGTFFNLSNHGSKVIVIDGLKLQCTLDVKYGANAVGYIGTQTGFNMNDITIQNCEITGFYAGVYMDSYYGTPANRPITNISIIGNLIYDIWQEGIYLQDYSADTASNGTTMILGNVIYDVNMGWMSEETICPSGGGDVGQLSCWEGNVIIRYNIFDKRGRSAKQSLIISYSKKWYFGRQDYKDITRNVDISWNTFLLGFGLEGGYPCDGGRDNRGAYSCMQLYQMDTLWFHNNTIDGTKWEYGQTYGRNELHAPAFSNCQYNVGYFYDNLFLGCSQENALASGVPGAKLYFINNTILPAYRTADITFDYIFLTGSAEVYSYNNFTLGNENLSFSYGSGVITESNNVENFKGSGEYGDTASFVLDYAIPQLSSFNLKPTDESVHLIDEGYAFEFTTTGWWDSIPTVRFDIDSLERPIDDYDVGAFEFNEEISNDPPLAPTGLFGSNGTSTSVTLNWDLGEDVDHYMMSVWDDDGNPFPPYMYYNIGYVSSLDLTGLTPLGSGNAGKYHWWIRAVNDYGFKNSDTCYFKMLQESPTADFESDVQEINTGDTVTFTNLSECTICSYEWVFEGGTPNELKTFNIDETPEVEYPYAGMFDVTLAAINESGEDIEVKTDYITVTNEITAPTSAFHSDKQSARIGQSIHFINETVESGTMVYAWTFEGTEDVDFTYLDQTDENSKNPVVKYLVDGTYDVTLNAENEAGNNDEVKENYLTILPGLLKRFLYLLR